MARHKQFERVRGQAWATMVRKYNEFAPSDGFLTRRANERDDRCERRVSEFIGRETIDPFGKIVGGYIDACNVMLFEIELPDGDVIDNEPRTTVIFRRCATGGET